MARLESQMEDMMGYPTGGDPSIIDPTTGKPYDDSSRMRQQAEITRQADAMEEFQPVELPEYLKTKVEEKQSSPASEVSTDKLKTAYDALVIPKKPLKRDSKGRPLESLRPKLRPTEDFGPSFNFKSPIDKTIELNYLLRDPKAKTKSKEIVSGLSEKTEEGERAVQGFYDSVAKGQGLSATENAWCAAFVHYILTELGADTLKGMGGQRARKYIDYGSPVKIKDAQEGDIVIFDWNGDGRGQHVAFYAGTRITDQDNPNKISVVGGNQNDKVTLMTRDMSQVLGIRRITKDNINVKLSKDLAKNNPIFKLFVPAEVPAKDIKLKQGPRISNTEQADPFSVIPARYAEGGSVTNLERETEEALGLPPRAKYTSTAVQDTADLLDKEIAEAKSAGISQEPPTASDIADTVIDFTPVIGDIKGAVEGAEVIFEELEKDDPNFLLIGVIGGAGVVGLIPGVGDAAQKLIIKGAKRFRKKELSPELMESLTLKEQEIVEDLNKKTVEKPNTSGEEIADFIAESLRNNKLEYITDDILTGLGNDGHRRLTQHYIDGNVGMDLPMDWESTMARAADQGFTELRYHGSNIKDLDFFFGQGEKRGAGMFNSPDVFKALTYETPNGQTYSLLMRPLPEDTPKVDVEGATWGNLDEPSIEYNRNKLSPDVRTGPRMDRVAEPLDTFVPQAKANITTDMFMRKASDLGYPGATIENVVDRGAYTPRNLSLEEGQNIRTKASIPSETQARTDTTGIRTLFGRFDPRLQNLKNINMAQGGLTSMNDQTQMAFALGGEAETVDPVSGNDVPPGSLPEEVRDDIDAKLSEGEYVVPADVVRFFGVKFFEDLRTEAKMGLQQMDADGRIGGEPVQEQPQRQDDSMDVAKLKAALSSSGMYAGGLTDGDSLDNFIDDASRDPMVNGRMRAGGASVKMAVGGLAPTGTYGDVTKVDSIIKQLMTAANNDPNLMQKLSDKGIMVNKTGADKKSAEMQQANKPQEPLKADKGTLVSSDPFDLEKYDTLGGSLFDAAGIEDPLEAIEETFLDSKGVIEQIVLIGPDGMEIPVAWNSAMPIPKGFTKKATNEYGGATTATNAATSLVSKPRMTNAELQKKINESDGGIKTPAELAASGETIATDPFNYREESIEALADRYNSTKKFSNAGSIIGLIAGPIGTVIGIAAKANHEIVKRRIEIEIDTRVKEGKITSKDFGTEKEPSDLKVLFEAVSTKLPAAKYRAFEKEAELSSLNPGAMLEKGKRGLFGVAKDQTGVFDKFLDAAAQRGVQNAADKIAEEVLNKTDGIPIISTSSNTKPKLKGIEKVTALKAARDFATTKRLEKEREIEAAREAARKAAQAAAAARSRANRVAKGNITGGSSGDGGGTYDYTNPTKDPSLSPPTAPELDLGGGSSSGGSSSGSNLSTARSKNEAAGGYTGGGKYGGFESGGLVSAPAAKQKKRKTQRRKGLGTRP